jgi:hypothetical protein
VAHIYNRNWKLEHIITGGEMNSDGLVSNKDFIEIGKPRDTPYIVYENFISAQTKILKYKLFGKWMFVIECFKLLNLIL